MKRARIASVVLLSFAATLMPFARPASASCAAPIINADPASAPAGATILVSGKYFANGCADVITCQVGQPCPTPSPPPPARDIDITFRQSGETWPLARVSANGRYRFYAHVKVPDNATPGPAKIFAEGQWSAPFTVALPATGETARPRTIGFALVALSGMLVVAAVASLRRARTR